MHQEHVIPVKASPGQRLDGGLPSGTRAPVGYLGHPFEPAPNGPTRANVGDYAGILATSGMPAARAPFLATRLPGVRTPASPRFYTFVHWWP